MVTRLLVWLGIWSRCCHAPTYMPYGWARSYCTACDRRAR